MSAAEEVVQRLLLDGVDAESARATVGTKDEPVDLAGADEAEAMLAIPEVAGARERAGWGGGVVWRAGVGGAE